jgi:hypothetical protein
VSRWVPEEDLLPSHLSDVSSFWNNSPKGALRMYWKATYFKNKYTGEYDAIYLTIYSYSSHEPKNHHVPKLFRPWGLMYGDVFVARLGWGQRGNPGRAHYQNIESENLDWICRYGRYTSRVDEYGLPGGSTIILEHDSW